jgi:nucleoside-diphosphate kinase
MKIRQTLIIIKPDALNRSLVGTILQKFEQKGLKICGLKMVELKDEILDEHYSHHLEKPFFGKLKKFMMQSPSVLVVLEGMNAINVVRQLAGETHGAKALPGTIRGDFSLSTQANVVHASEDEAAAEVEIKRFFKPEELFEYNRVDFEMLYAEDERNLR